MKLSGEKNCKAKVRNLPGDGKFQLRIEYDNPKISIFYRDSINTSYESCITME